VIGVGTTVRRAVEAAAGGAFVELLVGVLVEAPGDCADPLEGFADPLEGFADPMEGFADPMEGFADPLEGFFVTDGFFFVLIAAIRGKIVERRAISGAVSGAELGEFVA